MKELVKPVVSLFDVELHLAFVLSWLCKQYKGVVSVWVLGLCFIPNCLECNQAELWNNKD